MNIGWVLMIIIALGAALIMLLVGIANHLAYGYLLGSDIAALLLALAAISAILVGYLYSRR
jgi:hypothetical protein